MKPVHLKVARIGNSRGVRLPAATLDRYQISDSVVMEERSDGILLRPQRSAGAKLSWEDTAEAMVSSREDWSDWDSAVVDGLDDIPWDTLRHGKVAEAATSSYSTDPTRPRKKRT